MREVTIEEMIDHPFTNFICIWSFNGLTWSSTLRFDTEGRLQFYNSYCCEECDYDQDSFKHEVLFNTKYCIQEYGAKLYVID